MLGDLAGPGVYPVPSRCVAGLLDSGDEGLLARPKKASDCHEVSRFKACEPGRLDSLRHFAFEGKPFANKKERKGNLACRFGA